MSEVDKWRKPVKFRGIKEGYPKDYKAPESIETRKRPKVTPTPIYRPGLDIPIWPVCVIYGLMIAYVIVISVLTWNR